MKVATVDAICAILDGSGAEYERRDYSGRGMGGKTTGGIVVGDIGSFIGAVANAAVNLAYAVADDTDDERHTEAEETLSAFVKDVSRVAIDSMGKSDIIVY